MPNQYYYLTESRETIGPVTWDLMLQFHKTGVITNDTLVTSDDDDECRKFTDAMSERGAIEWYYIIDNRVVGPVCVAKLKELISNDIVKSDTKVRRGPKNKWRPLSDSPFPKDWELVEWYHMGSDESGLSAPNGPICFSDLMRLEEIEAIKFNPLVRKGPENDWRPLSDVSELDLTDDLTDAKVKRDKCRKAVHTKKANEKLKEQLIISSVFLIMVIAIVLFCLIFTEFVAKIFIVICIGAALVGVFAFMYSMYRALLD